MSNKRFTVIDTRTNSTKQWDSTATNLGELKAELENLGISTDGMAIQEGLTNTELVNNNSILPHDVPYRGTVTNNLVFRLTRAEKNITSGIDRKELYDFINKLGLQQIIKDTFGRNFTQISTEKLEEVVNKNMHKKCECKESEDSYKKTVQNIFKAFNALVNNLYDNDFITGYTYNEISSIMKKEDCKEVDSPYSAEELDNMFANM